MDRKQLETMAASNHYLRGLLALPVGMVLVVSALGNAQWGVFRGFWVVPVCWAVAAAMYLALFRYYNDAYGRRQPRFTARGALGTVAAIVVMGGGPALVQALDLPLNGIALAWAVVALAYYGLTVGLRRHHLVIWGAVLVVALVPLWGDPRTTNTANVGLLLVAAAVMLHGVFDHQVLVRTFGPPLQASDAGA
jgi:hypothetical protein